MVNARLAVLCAVLLFAPSLAFALDRSACKQYGGNTDCWPPVIGPWKYEVCGEVGGFGAWSAAECTAQGGQWLGGTCVGAPPPELRRPVDEGDISSFAEDTFYHYYTPICDGPSSAGWSWGQSLSSTLCSTDGPGAVYSQGHEVTNNTNHFAVTGKQLFNGVCGPGDYSINFSAKRNRLVECAGSDDQSQQFTTGTTPAMCTLYWHRPINPKQCPDCEPKNGNPVEVGNPLNPITLAKHQRELDYAASGPHALRFERVYLSRAYQVDGKFWRHNYSSSIDHQTFGTVPVAAAHRANGRTLTFKFNGSGYVADVDIDDRLTKLVDGSGAHTGWEYYDATSEHLETYDAQGKLVSIADRAGLTKTLSYTGGLLTQVTDAFGRSLSFTYNARGRMLTMQDPAGQTYTYTYLSSQYLQELTYAFITSVTYPDGKTRTYVYNEPSLISGSDYEGRLTGIIDENNNRYAYYRHESGFAVRTELAGAVNRYTVTHSHSGWPNNVIVTDPLGTARTYAYQKKNNVYLNTSITQPAASGSGTAQSTRTYDANGNLATFKDFNGNRTNYTFDSTRNLQTSRTEGLTSAGSTTAQTRTISTAWHATFRLPTQIAEPLKTTTNVYDADGTACGARGALCSRTLQATTDTNGSQGFSATPSGTPRTWSYTYNANGSVLTVNGPRTDVSDVTTYTYYSNSDLDPGKRGQVATITNPASHVTSITAYNLHGQPTTIVDANAVTTTLTYDARQRLTSRTTAGETTTYDYDGVGQLTKVTLPDSSYLSYTYDNAHRLTAIEDNQGNRIAYTLDNMGNRTQEQVLDPSSQLAQTRSRVFNSLNRLYRELGAQSQTTEYAYDNQGNVTSVKNALNHVTANQYDALNRLKQVTDPTPVSGVTKYAYNGQDQLVQVTDPRNLVTGYTVDGLGNLTVQASPDTGNTSNTHDAAGNLLTQTDAKGQVTTYAYDALNRVSLITFDDGAKQEYAYDAGSYGIGRLTGITERDPSNQITAQTAYTYDSKGRLVSDVRTVNAIAYTTAYRYDAYGRRDRITYPSGRTVDFSFDSLGRIAGVASTPNGGSPQTLASSITYQPFGGLKGFTFGNSQTYARTYDQDGRITSYTLGGVHFTVGYDAASRITLITETSNPPNTNTYGYDNVDRLTSATLPATSYGYTYDAVGNRLTRTAGSSTDTYAYSSTSNRIDDITPPSGPVRSFTFDNNGSTTADGNNTYVYDVRGRVVSSTSSAGTTSYQVNALGQRIRKTNTSGDTVFHYDDQGHLIAETTAAGALVREYVWLGDTPLAVIDGSAYSYIHVDHLNTPRLVADATGTTVWLWEQQEPFGVNWANENPGGAGVFDMPLRFPGQYFDVETGLHYNYFRDYDSSIGRYGESDPIGLKGGLNTYAYVAGRPLDRIDTVGLEAEIPNVGQSCFLSCIAVTTYRCIQQPQIGLTMCAACLLLRSPPIVAACLAGCTRNPTAVCVAVATVGCTATCAIADLCFRRYAQ